MKLKDLKTTYNTLEELDFNVPEELYLHLAEKIRNMEANKLERKMSKLSEEDLIEFENKPRRTLKIYTFEGKLIQKRTNEATFRRAMAELDGEKVASLHLKIGRKDLVIYDVTKKRLRLKGYACISPGYFVLAKSTIEEKVMKLLEIDKKLKLNWDIE